MKMILVSLLLICLSFCSRKSLAFILKEADRQCELKNPNWKEVSSHQLRMRLLKQGSLEFLKQDSDTFFLLQSYYVESGTYYGAIFNQRNILSYEFYKDSFTFLPNDLYPEEMIRQVRRWDTLAIRGDSRKFPVSPETLLKATRVVRNDKRVDIKCIVFQQYFNNVK